jgi:hypothetical protein
LTDGFTASEINILRETVWHALQRGDVPDEDKGVLHQLYFKLDGTPSRGLFKNETEELHFYLIRAENHAQKAQEVVYRDGPGHTKRSLWFRLALNRAQNILMKLYVRDVNRKKI